jgi:DsbC/DsbD-like thiol-disulfide interchange protein
MRTILIAGLTLLLTTDVAAQTAPPAVASETAHLTVKTSSSAPSVADGTRLSLYVDVTPKPKIHVYAPGEPDAIPVSLTIGQDDAAKPGTAEFPKPEKFFFESLNLTQLVYSKPFRITQPVTITPAARDRAKASDGTITLKGTLRYQACDDKVCYPPKNVPLEWKISADGR